MGEQWQATLMFGITFLSVPSALCLIDYAKRGGTIRHDAARWTGALWLVGIFIMWTWGG